MPRRLMVLSSLLLIAACKTAAPVIANPAVSKPKAPAPTPADLALEERLDIARFGTDAAATKRDFNTLREELKKAVQQTPEDAHLHYLLGRVYFYLEQDAEARWEFDLAIALAPDVAEYHYLKGYFLRCIQDMQGAAAEMSRATELEPQSSKYWAALGSLLASANENDGAVKAFHRAMELNPNDAGLSAEVGLLLLSMGKEAEAFAYLGKTTAEHPKDETTQYNIGQAYQNKGDHPNALVHFRAASQRMPDDWRMLAKLVQEHAALNQPVERDGARARLMKLHADGKVESAFFVREQFQVGEAKVMVAENFKLEGAWAVRYTFYVTKPGSDGAALDSRMSLGSYEFTQHAKASSPLASAERIFHFDSYEGNSRHLTYAFFDGEPSYEVARKLAVAVLRDEVKPISGTTAHRE
ncbi:tetratricopeptide repeat protein [Myxococcaceae bacterium JPH2]|nr:tetratricopeptide repeat protein [Myxococcaceae bacterium JPH2]